MSEHLRQLFQRSRHLMSVVFTRSSAPSASSHTAHVGKSGGIVFNEAAPLHVPSEMVVLMQRVHRRLDAIEEKIDQLLMPVDATKH
jgi:hypothetical protein